MEAESVRNPHSHEAGLLAAGIMHADARWSEGLRVDERVVLVEDPGENTRTASGSHASTCMVTVPALTRLPGYPSSTALEPRYRSLYDDFIV